MNLLKILSPLLALAGVSYGQTPVEVTRVVTKAVERQVKLPAELQPYLAVPIHAKVTGFVQSIRVDRGSLVKESELLATLVAPEMEAQIVEAKSKAQAVELRRAEAQAKLAAAESTYQRLKAASATAGVVAENDVIVAQKGVEAAQALVRSFEGSIKAAQSAVEAVQALAQYLRITAPFDGIIVERKVHPGALVGPNPASPSLFQLQQVSRLRLVVAVPEAVVGGIVKGARVAFAVPAYPGEKFLGAVSRIPYSMDEKTRTMAVELDVNNPGRRLTPGMYPEVLWPVRKPRPSLLVPPTAIVTTTERTFVIRVENGVTQWVTVSRGPAAGELVEVFGNLQEGDQIVRRGSDEIREGMHVKVSAPQARPAG